MMPKKIAIATGTRADWGLLLPLAQEFKRRGITPSVLATNAHLNPLLGNTLQEIINDGFLPIKIDSNSTTASPAEICGYATIGFSQYFDAEHPDCVVILGDRFEMLGVASAALLSGIPIVHIAGGTVSEGAIDNVIRAAISSMATLHLVETPLCAQRLTKMDIAQENIHVCGALGVYNVLKTPLMSRSQIEESLNAILPKKFFLATLHAATIDTLSPFQQMQQFLEGCEKYMQQNKEVGFLFTYPNNDVDPAPQIALMEELRNRYPDRILIYPSLGRVRYLSALALAEGVVGNSSSGIVEVTSMGIPVLDIGVRQKGRETGPAVLHVEGDADSVSKGLETISSEDFKLLAGKKINPYYQPDTPQLMADIILQSI